MEFPAGNTQAMSLRNWRGRYQALTGCQYTGAALVSGIVDLMVHLGRFFTTPDVDTDVDIASPKSWLYITPDDENLIMHTSFCVFCGTGCYVELFEAPTVTANGTPIPVYNHCRDNTYESQLQVFADPTFTDAGTRLDVSGVGSAGGNVKVGGTAQAGRWDLKVNSTYLLRATTLTDNALMTLQTDHFEFDRTLMVFPEDDGGSSSSA